MKVGDFIRKLPAEQLEDLASGEAKLELVPKGGRPAPARRTAAAKPPAVSTEEIRAFLTSTGDADAATRYLNDLRLTVPATKSLATELGVGVQSKAPKAAIVAEIVKHLVTRRLDFDALSRPAPARF